MKFLDDLAEGIVKTDREMTERYNADRKRRWFNYSVALLLINILLQQSNTPRNNTQKVLKEKKNVNDGNSVIEKAPLKEDE